MSGLGQDPQNYSQNECDVKDLSAAEVEEKAAFADARLEGCIFSGLSTDDIA